MFGGADVLTADDALAAQLFDPIQQLAGGDGLRDVAIHACRESPVPLTFHGVSGQGDDRQAGTGKKLLGRGCAKAAIANGKKVSAEAEQSGRLGRTRGSQPFLFPPLLERLLGEALQLIEQLRFGITLEVEAGLALHSLLQRG